MLVPERLWYPPPGQQEIMSTPGAAKSGLMALLVRVYPRPEKLAIDPLEESYAATEIGLKVVAGMVIVTSSEGIRKNVCPRTASETVIHMLHVPSTISPAVNVNDQSPAFRGSPVISINMEEDGVYGDGGL